MALDAATLELTARELKTVLADAKIAKLFEPTRDELVITLRTRTDTYALLLSARSGSARVCLTEETFENPETPPSFCMLMRKHLTGGKLLDVHEAWINVLPYNIPMRVVYFVVSYCLISLGIALSNRCKRPIVPTDLFPRELADITGIPYPKIKIGFDVICLAVTAGLTLGFLHHLEGLGIGTIAAAFTMGKAIGFAGDVLDKHFLRKHGPNAYYGQG